MSTATLLAGVCQMVDGADLAVYDVDRVWTAADTEWMVAPGELPPYPDRAVGVQCYTVRDDPALNDSLVGVQFRIRGPADDLAAVYEMNDQLFVIFQGLSSITMNGIGVVVVYRQNSMPAGQDDSDRYIHAASFYWQLAWPTTHRTD